MHIGKKFDTFALLLACLAIIAACEKKKSKASNQLFLRGMGTSTLVVLPDTQGYSQKYPETFATQTRWIKKNLHTLNISHVVHLGDIVQNDVPKEWEAAQSALNVITGKVPISLVPGNHDYSKEGKFLTRKTLLNNYFSASALNPTSTFGGAFEADKIDNTFSFIELGNRPWLVINLEWAPRDAVLAWAGNILEKYSDHLAIIVTHAYLYSDNSRYDYVGKHQKHNPHFYNLADQDSNDGEQIWDKLVSKYPNVMMTLSGHVLGTGVGYLASKTRYGNVVHQMLSNYQMLSGGGNGYLRVLQFQDGSDTVKVRTFSPLLDEFNHASAHDFDIHLTFAKDS